MAEIRLEAVRKSFGDVTVVREIDLTIRDGEFFTFLGPSGCGKSTILNMIAGLEPVTAGTIFFDGGRVNDASPQERDVAMVFQSYALYPHMTVRENLSFPLRMKKASQELIGAEVARVAAMLGLDSLLGRRPKDLSGGQRQRVALGRAIIRRPRVFLMDEPLSNLDARLRGEMRAELKKLHIEIKTTIVYVTHDQAEAMGLSDRIAVVQGGVVQQCAEPREIYQEPANMAVAGFVGSPMMNFLDGKVVPGERLAVSVGGEILHPGRGGGTGAVEVALGVRPVDIVVSREAVPGGREAVVRLVEPAGAEIWVDVEWAGASLKGRAPADQDFPIGGRVYITIPDDRICVFDRRTGLRA